MKKMKSKAKTPKKTERKAAVTSRAYPELRCRIDECMGNIFPGIEGALCCDSQFRVKFNIEVERSNP